MRISAENATRTHTLLSSIREKSGVPSALVGAFTENKNTWSILSLVQKDKKQTHIK
jgi:hypothetical protein